MNDKNEHPGYADQDNGNVTYHTEYNQDEKHGQNDGDQDDHDSTDGFDQKHDVTDVLDQEHRSNEWLEWGKALGFAVIIALVIRVFLFAPIVVDGESMLPTLDHGERLIVNKAVYHLGEPERGEIIVFHATESKDWIKRVIGEPGDTIQYMDGNLTVNGELIDEAYINDEHVGQMGNFEEVVPEDHLFVMGDNRPNSQDSRNVGPIPIDSVIGRAEFVFWPFGEIRMIDTK